MNNERGCVIYGAGGHGKVVADAAIAAGLRVQGFVDDVIAEGTVVLARPDLQLRVLGKSSWLDGHERGSMMIGLGIGHNDTRRGVAASLSAKGFVIVTIVHPSAIVSPFAVLGIGSVVMASAVLNPATHIGLCAIVNTGSVIEHDCEVGDYAHISPNATLAGGARVGALSHVGTGAVILPGICVGTRSMVGAGAVVNRNVDDDQLVIGVPAKPREL